MSSGTLTRRNLTEYVQASPRKVDEAEGVIYGCRYTGLTSDNGRRYTEEAITEATPLYASAPICEDHPDKPGGRRKPSETLGWFENIEPTERRADFHLLMTHPRAATYLEAAKKRPQLFGFSHNVDVDGVTEDDGTFVIHKILEVHSVDVVARPATTTSFFESKTMTKTFREWLTARPKADKVARQLLEDMGDDPMGDTAMAAEPAGDHKEDLMAAIAKLLDDGSDESTAMATKIFNMLKPKVEPAAAAKESDDMPADGKKDDKKDDDKDTKKMESLDNRESVLDLCESLDFQPSKVQRKALVALTEDADRKALIEDFKAGKAKPAGNGTSDKPRSRLQAGLTESKNGKGKVTDYDSFFARVMN